MMPAPILEAIHRRRSIREYTEEQVGSEQLRAIIEAGSWAPSGLNNQPWRFVVVRDPAIRAALAGQTTYGHIVKGAPAVIAVYLDREAMYHETKDQQAAGACLQNMLLAAEALDLGAVWLGQILQNKTAVNGILGLSDRYELAAVVAVGHPRHRRQQSTRKPLSELILKEL
ncbi:MAG: nitroreductase family protein [Desulfobacteraceae bacterium]|nr:nitroreductase family protein [Desulfobacteraceae bacterium]